MRKYTKFIITEGVDAAYVEKFNSLKEALDYIDYQYGADCAVDQLVQIDASNDAGDEETFSYFEVYDMLTEEEEK